MRMKNKTQKLANTHINRLTENQSVNQPTKKKKKKAQSRSNKSAKLPYGAFADIK